MTLREDAINIWNAGLAAVNSSAAVNKAVSWNGSRVSIGGTSFDTSQPGRILAVGAGKAGAGMAAGLEAALLPHLAADKLSGFINVPFDCLRPSQRIQLHAARPPGLNAPTAAAVEGTRIIIQRLAALTADDLAVVLLSGGASALLCQPVPPVTLDDKRLVTQLLSSRGATIHELNRVRSQISLVKSGRLAAACQSRRLVTLIISDVLGDPLDVIGSGPTVPSAPAHEDAIQVLERYGILHAVPASVRHILEGQPAAASLPTCDISHCLIATNKTAQAAATDCALRLGYHIVPHDIPISGPAGECGRVLVSALQQARISRPNDRVCIISGGEPTVDLSPNPDSATGVGGRNQELVLAAISQSQDPESWRGIALLSGGTDGEDGPTDAAGAVADAALLDRIASEGIKAGDYLHRHDSWSFFHHVGGHLKTGPTHTNVMDLRVGLAAPG
jgi:glycerate-2-kinase